MAIDINDMLIFLTVVEAGSFTLAADRLGIPKANISRKVARLEERLGVRLLERTTRSQHLTEAGKRYLHHCKRIQEEVDLAEVSVAELLDCYCGRLRIGASVAIGQQLLRPELSSFMKHYPELEVQMNLVNRRVDLIEEGFDMLIRVGELEDSSLIAKPLGQVRRKLYASPDYFVEKAFPETLDELGLNQMLIMGSIHGKHAYELTDGKQYQRVDFQPRLLADDFSIVKQGVIDGLGVGLFPEYMCSQELNAGTLIPVLPNWSSEPVSIYALYPKQRVKIPKVKAFLDFVVEVFARRLSP